MSDYERSEQLRALFEHPELGFNITRLIAVATSVLLVVAVLWLVRRGKLREEYTPIWMGAALVLAVLSFRFDLLYALSRAIGAWTLSSTLFFFGEVFLTLVCLNYAVRLSRTTLQLKNLAQEVALLRTELNGLRGREP